jgi:DNA-binding SARP family transcriptional activator/tetratricopeptide (TPR) repeat protein
MEFSVLGPIEVADGARQVELRAPKQRILLSVLLCHADAPVSVDRLLDALWGASPPRTAVDNLRLYVHQLRRALGDGQRIVRRPPGYALTVRQGELDAARFEELADAGRNALTDGDPTQAARLLREGLALWRGTPFAGLDHVDLLREEASRLQERHQAALESRIEADLAIGRHNDLIAELSALVTRHPLREQLRVQLMLALYRAGRQAEALAVARDTRRLLAKELGIDPGPHLKRMEQAILSADKVLELPAVTAKPATPERGRTTGDPVPRQLPAHTPHFVGRSDELNQLTKLLDAATAGNGATPVGTVVISAIGGTAGIGKTTLAVRWAHQVTGRFPDGQLYANLRGFDPGGTPAQPAEVVRGFLDAFHLPPERIPLTLDAQTALYRSLMTGRRMLVLLDNARDVEQVRPLLPGSSTCLVLVTSRNRMASLAVQEGARPLTLDVLSTADAEALLANHLGHDRIAAERETVLELIAHCGRLPLALAIVAARAATQPEFPLRLLADELSDEQTRLDALDVGDSTANLRAVFSWSSHHLDARSARLFLLLGLHPGPDIGSAVAASLSGVSLAQARTALAELTRAHLLDRSAPDRFAFHDLLRVYAADEAAVSVTEEERRAVQHRMLDHYVHTANAADRLLDPHRDRIVLDAPQPGVLPEHLDGTAEAWAWCAAEYPVLLAVITHAARLGFDRHAWQMAWLLGIFFERCGHWHEWDAASGVALEAAIRLGDKDGQGRAYLSRARACALLTAYDTALPHLAHALDIYQDLDDPVGQAHTHHALSWVLEHQGHLDDALGHSQRTLDLYQRAGHLAGQARALNMVGWDHAKLGDHQRALACCQQALGLHRELGDSLGEAHTWDSLGFAHHCLGNHSQAISCYEQAITRYQGMRNRYYEAGTLARLADTLYAMGDALAARLNWQHALHLFDDLRHPDADQVRAKLTALQVE